MQSVRKPGDLELGRILGSGTACTLSHKDRLKHLYVCGGTGVGKSKFIERLIRQDIIDWPKTKAGLLLIDPHGAVYDGLMTWMAERKIDRPIIPIDLRCDEWVVSYNLLRKRTASASVIVDNFIAAVAHVWGQSGTDQTPQFAQWGSDTIRALYEKGYSLAEAVYLTDRSGQALRRFMTAGLTDQLAAKDWEYANQLTPKDFDAQIGSTLRRLARFIRTDLIRAILGQTDLSLDLGEAIEDGHIILVSLAREGAKVSKEDADLFATLLLSDLWISAQERGKPLDSKVAKRFNVYIDEFSRFVTPTMAEQLAEARGFGLALTMAQQFPRQLVTQGKHGERLFDEVMENASTKVVFRLQDTNNLKPLAEQLFLGTFDPDLVKLKLYGTRVLAYRQETRLTHAHGESESEGESYGSASGRGKAAGRSTLSSESHGDQYTIDRDLDPSGELRAWNDTFGTASGQTDTDSEFESQSESTSTGRTKSRSVAKQIVDVPVLGKELSSVQYRTIDEQLFRSMQKLFVQQDRQCVIRIVGNPAPVFLETYDVAGARARKERVDQYIHGLRKRWPFYIPMAEAMKRIAAREKNLQATALRALPSQEPTTSRRRTK